MMLEVISLKTVVFLSLLVAPVILYLIYLKYEKYRVMRYFKGTPVAMPPEIPVIGHSQLIASLKNLTDLWHFITEQQFKYPDGVLYWVAHLPWLLVPDLSIVETILSSPEAIEKSDAYQVLKPVTDGVMLAEGNKWRKLRKKMNLTFSPRLLELYLTDVEKVVNDFVQETPKNEYFDVYPFMERFFYDEVLYTHFNTPSDDQKRKEDNINRVASTALELLFSTRLPAIHYHNDWIFSWTSTARDIQSLIKKPISIVKKIIMEQLKNIEEDKIPERRREKGSTYIEKVIEVMKELKMPLDDTTIYKTTNDIIIGVTDTTSVAGSCLFYYLALYPDVQQKVYEEVKSVYGEDKFRSLTKDDLSRLVYLEMAVKEATRLCCPPGVIRQLKNDLDVGKYVIPRGTNVYVGIKGIHRNKNYYERPNEFYPDHFLPEKVLERPKMSYLAFSYGPRNCPGVAYAIMSLKYLASAVIRNFKVETNLPLSKVKRKVVLMEEHTNGYPIRLIPRET